MAFLKSIILLVFFIHWVKAVQFQNDIDAEFNKIFHQIRHTMDNAWRWMREAANKSYLRINEVFTARRPMDQDRFKYQDVVASNEAPVKPEDTQIQSETKPLPLTTNQETEKLIPVIPNPASELPSSSQQIITTMNPQESANLQKGTENEPENETTKIPEQPAEPTESECEDDSPTEETTTNGQVESETQTESQIPLEAEPDVNKLELPVVQDFGVEDPSAIQGVPESNDETTQESNDEPKIIKPIVNTEKEPEIIIADPAEHIEYEMKTGLSRSIYQQQNIIILFLFFLIVIMSAYFFLLSRNPHVCPTIVIGELGNNLKPTMHNIKK